MPINMSKYWNILNIIASFFKICIFLFLRHSEKYCFRLSCDWRIRTIHCRHNYLKWNLNSKFKLQFKIIWLKVSLLLQTCTNRTKYPTSSVFLSSPHAETADHPFRIFLLECVICVNSILFFLALQIFLSNKRFIPKENHLRNRDGRFPWFF